MKFINKFLVMDVNFYKKVLTIAVPVTLQSLITIGINLMGTFMLGSLGEYQLSASSLVNNFYSIFQILCMGMGFGTAVMTSQYWGSKDIISIKSSVTIMYRINISTALFFTLISLVFPEEILRIYTSDPEIIKYGVIYLKVMSFTYIIQGLSLTTSIILRSIGKVSIPLYSSILAFGLNIFLSWIFIFGKLRMPRMEIAGAALATLIARAFEFVFILVYFIMIEKQLAYRIMDIFKPSGAFIQNFIKYSIPVIVSDFLLALGNNAIAVIMGHISAEFVSANAIIAVILQISTIFTQGISNASSIVTGITIGSGDKEKAYRQGVTFLTLSVVVGIIGALIIRVLAPTIIGYYKIGEGTKYIALQLMSALAITVIFQTVGSIMTKGVLRGGGDTKFLMIADILFLWVASVPLGLLASFVFGWSPFCIYICLRIDHILKSLWCVKRLASKKWIKVIDNKVSDNMDCLTLAEEQR